MKVHLIGIGGYGMKTLAFFLKGKGFAVSGSDICYTNVLSFLSEKGIKVWTPHNFNLIERINPDIVVYSLAVKNDNEELQWAIKNDKKIYTRGRMFSMILPKNNSITITGTDGKTTTTAMTGKIFLDNNRPYNLYVGGDTPYFKDEIIYDNSHAFISEIDESDPDFKVFSSALSVITNINYDHLENYSNKKEKQLETFKIFLKNSKLKVINDNVSSFFSLDKSFHTFSIKSGEIFVENVEFNNFSSEFTVIHKGDKFKAKLNVPYFHNIENSLAAALAAFYFGIPLKDSYEALYYYTGVKRRFEIKFKDEDRGFFIVDDYAHNPREVANTIHAARLVDKKLVIIFQPHRYTRFKSHWKDFANILQFSDTIIITDIFGAYEENDISLSPELLKKELRDRGKDAYYFENFEDIKNFVFDRFKRDTVILTLGAGTITDLCNEIVNMYV